MTLETQEPITTIEPILGLGEDYEPEIYALPIYSQYVVPINLRELCDRPLTVVFRTECDCPPGYKSIEWNTPKNLSRPGCPVVLADADLNIIKTWPV